MTTTRMHSDTFIIYYIVGFLDQCKPYTNIQVKFNSNELIIDHSSEYGIIEANFIP